MVLQRHTIKRQIIELSIRDPENAALLQSEVSRVFHQQIIPLLDQCFTELSSPDTLHRIESLELDLGALDPQQLEKQLVEKVDLAVRRELAAHIHEHEAATAENSQRPKARSQLELFSTFARTGGLPWWADTSQPELLAKNVEALLHESPRELRSILQQLLPDDFLRRRMVNQYTDEQLTKLAGLLVPAYETSLRRDAQALQKVIKGTQAASASQPTRLRQSIWDNLLQVASSGGQEHATLRGFYRAILSRVATELGSSMNIIVDQIKQEVGTILDIARRTAAQEVLQLLQSETDRESAPQEDPLTAQTPAREVAPAEEQEEIYVDNAGLVILWPFLESFFARVGLLENRQFVDAAARQRAVGLLQFVAAQDPAPPEYVLPLNKLLCGLDVTEVFDFGPPLLESEREECETVLEAVIAQVPILGEMSTAAFRGTFLLRAGVLSAPDGFPLLRVERETYDIVLERFPWSWEWVKLPWMDAPLRVEW